MVTVIKTTKSLRNVLHYNENKLKNNVAQLIHSEGFAKDTEALNFLDKLRTFEKRNSLNENVKLNTVHISLNFHADDKLSADKMREIACNYMERIGYGGQPFLVYRHFDAGHDHCHIVSTTIRKDGSNIRMFNIGRKESTAARIAIEKEFKLRPATANELKQAYELKPVNVQKIQYGKTETKRAVTNVLDHVLPKYKYTSVAELNAVLKLYNVMADTGSKESRIAKNGGLLYRILNDKCEKVGVPIKASIIYNKPTLKILREKFVQNEQLRQPYKQHIKNTIDFTIKKQSNKIDIDRLSDELKKEGINLVIRQNNEGRIYGITYIDHKNKSVFNGSDLGKPYAAAGLLERLNHPTINEEQKMTQQQKIIAAEKETPSIKKQVQQALSTNKEIQSKDTSMTANPSIQKALDILFKEEYNGSLAIELQNELKRRKRKRLRPE